MREPPSKCFTGQLSVHCRQPPCRVQHGFLCSLHACSLRDEPRDATVSGRRARLPGVGEGPQAFMWPH